MKDYTANFNFFANIIMCKQYNCQCQLSIQIHVFLCSRFSQIFARFFSLVHSHTCLCWFLDSCSIKVHFSCSHKVGNATKKDYDSSKNTHFVNKPDVPPLMFTWVLWAENISLQHFWQFRNWQFLDKIWTWSTMNSIT